MSESDVDTDVSGGLIANSLWSRYRDTRGAALKDRLIAYNRSDVTILAGVCAHLKAVHAGSVPAVLPLRQCSRDEFISHEAPAQQGTEANDQGGSWRRKLWERLRNRIGRGG